MRVFSRFFAAAFAAVSTVACSPALAQTKIASAEPEISSSAEPTIDPPKAPAAQDTTPLPPSLSAVATPTLNLAAWSIPKGPPALTCPSGSKAIATSQTNGWEVSCFRGNEKHGPSRSWDPKTLTEIQAVYDDGKLHGTSIEVVLKPELTVSTNSSYGGPNVLSMGIVAVAQKILADGWPLVSPTDPACPSGTLLKKSLSFSACFLPDDTYHGLQLQFSPSTVQVAEFVLGENLSGNARLDDRRRARESVYERGQLVRALEHEPGRPLTLEVRRGDEVAVVRFSTGRTGLSLSRIKKGKLHGVQQTWDLEGRLASSRTYQNGQVEGLSASWSGGQLNNVRLVNGGSGVEEQVIGNSRKRCQIQDDRPTLCETVDGTSLKVVAREVHKEGRLWAAVSIAKNGTKISEEHLTQTGERTFSGRWFEDGRPIYQTKCNEKECQMITWDDKGQPSTKITRINPDAPAHRPDPVTESLNAIRNLVGPAPSKPSIQVASP